MIGPRWRVVLLAFVCLAQLAVPAWMLVSRERVLAAGETFRFECAPVDPVDVFRGRYVALAFATNPVTVPEGLRFAPGQRVFLRVVVGPDGFALLRDPSTTAPSDGAFLRARAHHLAGNGQLSLDLPFDRYYLEEKLAPEAERAYRQRARGGARPTHVTVRLLDGRAVLEELYLDGLPVHEFLRR